MKYAEEADLSNGCDSALNQIRNRDYTAMLEDDGMKSILEYGIACHGKKCMVKVRGSR